MDASDLEDLLFSTQDVSYDAFAEDSDEDILFPDIEDEPLLWDMPNDLFLTPPASNSELGETANTDYHRQDSAQPQQEQGDASHKPVRDRYC